ncbi:MAG: hypothetical protein K9N49_03695 [Candidatus Marinimicrobia bacterium]|nr:hypothetical protein [Candidatus Neomarinimicrobiota bacterium]
MNTGMHGLLNSLLVFALALAPSVHRWRVACHAGACTATEAEAHACASPACGGIANVAAAHEKPSDAPGGHDASTCHICHLYSLSLETATPFLLAPRTWAAPEPAPATQAQPNRSFCRWAPATARAPPA